MCRSLPAAKQDRQDYWERRLSADYSLNTTGFAGLGHGFNRWSYRVQGHVFQRLVKPHLNGESPRVLDVGSGVGFWLEQWARLGAGSIVGSDITPTSVSTLSERFPERRIVQLDIGGEDLSPLEGQRFDAISAVSVLYHIPDDAAFERAYGNLFSLLDPGGVLIFNDNFVERGAFKTDDQAVRLGSDIEAVVRSTGFEIVEMRPMAFLMNNPVRARGRALKAWWRTLDGFVRRGELASSVAGAALYPLELALCSIARRGPSSEWMLCRKPG